MSLLPDERILFPWLRLEKLCSSTPRGLAQNARTSYRVQRTTTAFHKQGDYAKKPVCPKKRFLRCAMLRIAPVEMTA